MGEALRAVGGGGEGGGGLGSEYFSAVGGSEGENGKGIEWVWAKR